MQGRRAGGVAGQGRPSRSGLWRSDGGGGVRVERAF